ncbi:hypothetical protein QJQ45_004555 [Haematococcus lacustris]|nr:hypothetical protein QJQ45_004555 [Haematococcus lacustris]
MSCALCASCAMHLEEEVASVSQQQWGTRKQVVVFFGNASIGTRGGWGAKAVLQACRKVVGEAQQQQAKRQGARQRARAAPGDLGKWVDRDCNAALNLQRAGESKWRLLELCRWKTRASLPAKGKEYPALGFKKLQDRAPKAQAQQPVAQPSYHKTVHHSAYKALLPELLAQPAPHYLLFTSGTLADGTPWCPDCAVSIPIVR